ncbi:MAG: hypothetical protein OXG44_01435 [Gammaproteobacteria bacterium]|nr:hypothetical protein [Gammaproteobacteria bacterium]
MAGENITPMSVRHMVSIEIVLDADGAKGDLLRSGGKIGFLLQDGKKGDTVPLCIECDLVVMPRGGLRGVAGGHVLYDNGKFRYKSGNLSNPERHLMVGYLHRRAQASETQVEIVWRNFA